MGLLGNVGRDKPNWSRVWEAADLRRELRTRLDQRAAGGISRADRRGAYLPPVESLFRGAHQIALHANRQVGGGFRIRENTTSALRHPHALLGTVSGYELIDPGFGDGEQKSLPYSYRPKSAADSPLGKEDRPSDAAFGAPGGARISSGE